MKFYGNGSVWHSEQNKILCRFKNGVYETTNSHEIDYLLSKGYDNDGLQQEEAKEEVNQETKQNTPKRKR